MQECNFNEQTNALPTSFQMTTDSKILSLLHPPPLSQPFSLSFSLSLCYLLCRANLTVVKSLRAGPGVAGRHMNIESVRQASLAYENTVMGAHRPQTEACTLN